MLLPAERRRLLGAFVRSRREALPAGAAGRGRPGTAPHAGPAPRGGGGALRHLHRLVRLGRAGARHRAVARRARPPGRGARPSPRPSAPTCSSWRCSATRPRAGPGSTPCRPSSRPPWRRWGRPAYLIDRLWRARAWNEAAARLFAPWLGGRDPSPPRASCSAIPGPGTSWCDWDERARRVIAEFRADTARAPGDPALLALVAEPARREPGLRARCGTGTRWRPATAARGASATPRAASSAMSR